MTKDCYRDGYLDALRHIAEVARGEGEPGHPGEMISNNYLEELLRDLAEDLTPG